MYDTPYLSPREAKKYYFADFVHIGGYLPPPPSLTDIFFVKKKAENDIFVKRWSAGAVSLVKQIAAALARKNGQEESVVTSQLFGRLSLNLMRGNALMLSSRFQADCPPHVDGIL